MLKERDIMLQQIKENLGRAQQLMKNNADKHRRDLQLEVGSKVFLKLRSYRQQSVARRVFQKLAAKYYGPFEVLERIGKAAYRLRLPQDSKIHHVFHISQLKLVLGNHHEITKLPATLTDADEIVMEPVDITDTRYNVAGDLEVLVQWTNLPFHEQSWMRIKDLVA